jgi:hypothetical protein
MGTGEKRAFQHTFLVFFTALALVSVGWGVYSFIIIPFNTEDKTASVVSAIDKNEPATLGESIYKSTVLVPLVGGVRAPHWTSIPKDSALHTLVSEDVCDGDTTYLSPPSQSNTRAIFPVSLSSVPDGAQIVEVSIKPCIGTRAGFTNSDVVMLYTLTDKEIAVEGRGDTYILRGEDRKPIEHKPSSISVPHMIKTASTTLSAGVEVVRNGGGVGLSRLKVFVTYLKPLPPPENVSVQLRIATTTDDLLSLGAHLVWDDIAEGEDGYQIELSRRTESGKIISPYSIVGMLPKDSQTFSYSLVVDGVPTESYVSGAEYRFRVRASDRDRISEAKEGGIVAPSGLIVLSPLNTKATYSRGSGQVSVSWTNQVPKEIEKQFVVYRATENLEAWEKVGDTDGATSFSDFGPLVAGTYFYKVRTLIQYSGGGFLASDFSNDAAVEVTQDIE